MTDRGILYVASGKTYKAEALRSAHRIGNISDYNLALVTDSCSSVDLSVFDTTIELDLDQSWGCKPEAIAETPFEHTLYLDTDTYVVDRSALVDLFDLLDNGIELAAAHDTHLTAEHFYNISSETTVPPTYPWYNTGVLAFNSDETMELLESWAAYQRKFETQSPGINDQEAFRHAVYELGCSPHVLPCEYNYRVPFFGVLRGRARILHGSGSNYEEIAAKVNSGPLPRRRTYYPIPGGNAWTLVELSMPRPLRVALVGMNTVRRQGIWDTLRDAYNYYFDAGT